MKKARCPICQLNPITFRAVDVFPQKKNKGFMTLSPSGRTALWTYQYLGTPYS